MNIGEIKRYINDGLQPLSALIGTAEDATAKIGSLHAKSSFIIEKLADVATSISNISTNLSSIGGEKVYTPSPGVLYSTTFSFSPSSVYSNLNDDFVVGETFTPKYTGFLEMEVNLQGYVVSPTNNTLYAALLNTGEVFLMNGFYNSSVDPSPTQNSYSYLGINRKVLKDYNFLGAVLKVPYSQDKTHLPYQWARNFQYPYNSLCGVYDYDSSSSGSTRTLNVKAFVPVIKGFPLRLAVGAVLAGANQNKTLSGTFTIGGKEI